MANVLIEEQTLTDIADAIRAKSGKTDKMLPNAMSEEITNLSGGANIECGVKYLEFDEYNRVTKAMIYHKGNINEFCLYGQSCVTNVTFSNDNVTSIGTHAFYLCTYLNFTQLPDAIIDIDNYAFAQCSKLSLNKLPASLTTIREGVFQNCTSLAITEIPSEVTTIKEYAFQSCQKIVNLTFKGTPTNIHSKAFIGCSNIKTINVPWAEGEVTGAPWGATNATINYNYTG